MKALLDEQLDVRMKLRLSNFPVDVFSLHDFGWIGMKNGELIARLHAESFHFLISADKNLPFQQNIRQIEFSLVLLDTPSLDWSFQVQFIPKLTDLFLELPPEPFPKIFYLRIPGLSTGKKLARMARLVGVENIFIV